MYQPRHRRDTSTLYALLFLAGIYNAMLVIRHTLTGSLRLDGSIGVVLGLFICSRGAANLIDLALFSRQMAGPPPSTRATALWIALNGLVLVVGCIVVIAGATQFSRVGLSRIVY